MTSSPSHLVVGAGLSGLMTAHLLERQGARPLLVEARTRIGGRVRGARPRAGSPRVDLGPAWLWPDFNPRLTALVDALGLQRFPQPTDGDALVELTEQTLRRPSFEQGSTRLVGGMIGLVDAVHERLEHTRVRTGSPLLALDGSGSSLRATLGGSTPETVEVDSVLLAVPPRLLTSAVHWAPALPTSVTAPWKACPTWMAAHAKFVAAYERPFWRDRGLSGMAMSQVGPLAEIHDLGEPDGNLGVLFGFVGVPAPLRRQAGAERLRDACLAQLERLFGPAAATPVWTECADWSQDRWTAHERDRTEPPDHPTSQSTALPAPWNGRVFLAGSEFSPEIPGYLEGAVVAAERAVECWSAGRR